MHSYIEYQLSTLLRLTRRFYTQILGGIQHRSHSIWRSSIVVSKPSRTRNIQHTEWGEAMWNMNPPNLKIHFTLLSFLSYSPFWCLLMFVEGYLSRWKIQLHPSEFMFAVWSVSFSERNLKLNGQPLNSQKWWMILRDRWGNAWSGNYLFNGDCHFCIIDWCWFQTVAAVFALYSIPQHWAYFEDALEKRNQSICLV